MEMRKLSLILLSLLISIPAYAAAPSRTYNYISHTTIDPAQNNTNENNLYSYLQAGVDTYAAGSIDNTAISASAAIAYSKLNLIGGIVNADVNATAGITYSKLNLTGGIVNADVNASAAIVDTKLATISTAGKVSGAALTSLSSTPSGAGVMPTANLGSGTANSTTVLYGDQTYKSAPSSNFVFSYMGSIQVTNIVGNGTTLTNGAKAANYEYLVGTSAGTGTKYLGRFRKNAGTSTISGTLKLWITVSGGGRQGSAVVSIGSANSATMTETTSTPTSKTWSVDVSGLVNGTDYDITVAITDDIGSGNNTVPLCAEIVGFGS